MQAPRHEAESARRLFATYAVASLIPVIALGFVLSAVIRSEARDRGLEAGRSEAALLAHTAVEPQLGDRVLSSNRQVGSELRKVIDDAQTLGQVVRLRIRSLSGDVLYGQHGAPDDEALDAARGKDVARLTHLNTDTGDEGKTGVAVVEVYRPLTVNGARIGVLEVYLPYSPIRTEIAAGVWRLYVYLGAGLAVLYFVLAGIAASTTRRLRRRAEENAYLARHDTLTGLPNRSRFMEQGAQTAERARPAQQVAVAVMDLARFKEVNDTLGHDNGDQLLQEVGRRIAAALPASDVVARLGGDEFGLVLNGVHGGADVRARLERLRGALVQEIHLDGLPLSIDASFGFTLAPDDGNDIGLLLQRADVAMYAAKDDRSRIARYDARHDNYDAAKLALVAELRRAIDAGMR